MKKIISYLIFFAAFVSACKLPYEPPVIAANKNLLVVEGFINIGGLTTIRLTRTLDLKDNKKFGTEANATLKIESEDGVAVVQGLSKADGFCNLATEGLDISKKYRLRITTETGKEYLSDLIESKKTPEITDLGFKVDSVALQVYVNTHDSQKKTRYYGWTFKEKWAFKARYRDYDIDPSINITNCWQDNISYEILISSSAKLSEDKITEFPLTTLKGTSIELSVKYRIEVEQHGLTKEAYEYLQLMKKNSEQIGSIFDPQPTEIEGNIKCLSNPSELVIGYITGGTISKKVLFIDAKDKPEGTNWIYDSGCRDREVEPTSKWGPGTGYLVTDRAQGQVRRIVEDECADCRLTGYNVRPDFWPN